MQREAFCDALSALKSGGAYKAPPDGDGEGDGEGDTSSPCPIPLDAYGVSVSTPVACRSWRPTRLIIPPDLGVLDETLV